MLIVLKRGQEGGGDSFTSSPLEEGEGGEVA